MERGWNWKPLSEGESCQEDADCGRGRSLSRPGLTRGAAGKKGRTGSVGGREGKERVERERRSSAGLIGDTQVGGRASRTLREAEPIWVGVVAAGAPRPWAAGAERARQVC